MSTAVKTEVVAFRVSEQDFNTLVDYIRQANSKPTIPIF